MKQRTLKSVIFIVLLSAILLTLAISVNSAFAAEGLELTEQECLTIAENWRAANYGDEVEIGGIIPIYEGDFIGAYSVEYVSDDTPQGYVVIENDKSASNMIREFSLSGKGIYDTLVENSEVPITYSLEEKKIYSLGSFDYAVPVNLANSEFFTTNNEKLGFNAVKKIGNYLRSLRKTVPTSEYTPIDWGFSWGRDMKSTGYHYNELRDCSSFKPFYMNEFWPTSLPEKTHENKGNCSITAATNILAYYREKQGFINIGGRDIIYDRLVNISGFQTYIPDSDKRKQIGLSDSTINAAMKKYIASTGYRYSSDSYWFNLKSDWKRDIRNGYPVYTVVTGMSYNSGWYKSAHATVAIGYREYDANNEFYLRVLDGWFPSNNRYLLFDSEHIKSIHGICIKITL